MNQARSKPVEPKQHMLWIIKDDGKRLVWVSVLKDARNQLFVQTWDGSYEGEAAVVTNSGGVTACVSSTAPGTVHTIGEMPGLGQFVEDAVVMDDGKRLVCTGSAEGENGRLEWVEDFDLVLSNPY